MQSEAWYFATDLHGDASRWEMLARLIKTETPPVVLLGGDLLPNLMSFSARSPDPTHEDFLNDFVAPLLRRLRAALSDRYPPILVILGNDDPRSQEASALAVAAEGLWHYAHDRRIQCVDRDVYGYSYVPPSPFMLKDWERYDVSRYVDPGCVSPEEGWRSVPVRPEEARLSTIADDLELLAGKHELARAVMLFHSPPYATPLDRAALDHVRIDHVPADVHIGSIAIRRFIEQRRPGITLHGHVHEAARLTGTWATRIGPTWCFGAAHDGPELCVVRFDPANPAGATRTLH